MATLPQLERAKELINKYSMREFGHFADFHDLKKVNLATSELDAEEFGISVEDELEIIVEANLVDLTLTTIVDGNIIKRRRFCWKSFYQVLTELEFGEIVTLDKYWINKVLALKRGSIMGYFSWMFADTDNKIPLKLGNEFYLPQPFGMATLHERAYNGYGDVGDKDIFELVADWNREYLSKNPDHLIPTLNKKIGELPFYPYYADLSLSHDQIWELCYDNCGHEWREIGNILAGYSEDNAALPYPIKICKEAVSYESVGNSLLIEPNSKLLTGGL